MSLFVYRLPLSPSFCFLLVSRVAQDEEVVPVTPRGTKAQVLHRVLLQLHMAMQARGSPDKPLAARLIQVSGLGFGLEVSRQGLQCQAINYKPITMAAIDYCDLRLRR